MDKKRKKPAPATLEAPAVNLNDPSLYINRELGLLAFQRRVLEEAEDKGNPLLERVKFLAILGSNLAEFFMVRVAGLVSQNQAADRRRLQVPGRNGAGAGCSGHPNCGLRRFE
jgi:polyphosphate kinase